MVDFSRIIMLPGMRGKRKDYEESSRNTTLQARSRDSEPEQEGVEGMTWLKRAVICNCSSVRPP